MHVFQTVAVIAASVGLALPLSAQEAPTDLPEINAEEVSVGQVVSFVNAMIAAERVKQEYIAKIDAAESQEEIEALVAEADQKGIAEVERVRGISPAEYMAISLAAQENEELAGRIRQRLELMQESQALTVTNEPAERPEGVTTE